MPPKVTWVQLSSNNYSNYSNYNNHRPSLLIHHSKIFPLDIWVTRYSSSSNLNRTKDSWTLTHRIKWVNHLLTFPCNPLLVIPMGSQIPESRVFKEKHYGLVNLQVKQLRRTFQTISILMVITLRMPKSCLILPLRSPDASAFSTFMTKKRLIGVSIRCRIVLLMANKSSLIVNFDLQTNFFM